MMFVVIGKLSFFSCFSILTQHYLPNFCSRLIFLKKQQWQWVSLSNFQIIWTNFFCLQKHSSAFQSKTKTFLFPFEKKNFAFFILMQESFFFFLRKRQITGKPSKSIRCEVKKGSLPITTNIIQFEQGWHLDYYFHSTNRTAIYTQVKGFVPANRCQKSWESFFFACEILLYDLIRVCTHSLTAKKKHIIHVYSSKKKKWVKLLFI